MKIQLVNLSTRAVAFPHWPGKALRGSQDHPKSFLYTRSNGRTTIFVGWFLNLLDHMVRIYIYTYVYIYMYIHIYIYMYVYIYICICICMYIYIIIWEYALVCLSVIDYLFFCIHKFVHPIVSVSSQKTEGLDQLILEDTKEVCWSRRPRVQRDG